MAKASTDNSVPNGGKIAARTALLLALLLALFFCKSFDPDEVVFSNDGPLGGLIAALNKMPDALVGAWHDLNWIGTQSPTPAINVTSILRLVAGPVIFSKIFAPVSLFLLGLGSWFFFRKLKLSNLACCLGSVATALSSHFLSTACWGVASQIIAIAADFVALGLLVDAQSPKRWVKAMLAGMLVGLNIMEGYDIGAIFSLYVAAFVLFQGLAESGPSAKEVRQGMLRLVVVTGFAVFLASEALIVLIGTQIKGVAGTEQTSDAKAEQWDFATQWSMPPSEITRVIIPGLFGYRMDTPKDMIAFQDQYEGGLYWGQVGRDPAWDRYLAGGKVGPRPQGFLRFSGGGEYAGLLVVMVALWGLAESFRKKDSIYSPNQRRFIWFWAGAAFVSLLFAFGRYAPFYRLVYMLPYFSTIRNPAKFMHPFHWSMVILFAYGIHGLSRRYMEGMAESTSGLAAHLRAWWAKAKGFDKKWTRASLGAIGISFLGLLIYTSSRPSLERHLQEMGFPDANTAAQIAGFSMKETGWYLLFLVLTVGLLTLILSGRFGGRRAKWGGVLLGVLLVVDLARADLPWIIYQNYKEKYASNPVIDLLREKPYEHRVALVPLEVERLPPEARPLAEMYLQFKGLYGVEWMQHHFPYYNIQSLDIIQMPRRPVDYVAFEKALGKTPLRRWELTNTRYLLGPAALLEMFNSQPDPGQQRFRIVTRFDMAPKPGVMNPTAYEQITANINTNGQFAIFEFKGALPRAKLYANWQVSTNDQATLDQLSDKAFSPDQTVLVDESIPASSVRTNGSAGTVEITSYAPKKVALRAKSDTASVLLLNDKYDPNWKVTVDGKTATLLRCNYIMRGVQVPAGEHAVEFVFAPSITGLYVSLAAIILGVALAGVLVVSKPKEQKPEDTSATKVPQPMAAKR